MMKRNYMIDADCRYLCFKTAILSLFEIVISKQKHWDLQYFLSNFSNLFIKFTTSEIMSIILNDYIYS